MLRATVLPKARWSSIRGGSARLFHLHREQAATFLSKHVDSVQVDAEASGNEDEKKRRSICILLHADRRPQSMPFSRSTESIKTHFGPSLLGCHPSALTQNEDDLALGQGDLGILRAQKRSPSQVVQLPIALDKGLSFDYAVGFLLRMAPIIGLSLPEPLTWKAAEVLQSIWTVFKENEGIWFSFKLSFMHNQVSITDPYLEFDTFAVKRVASLRELYASRVVDPNTDRAEKGGLFYVKLKNGGNIGAFGYGAGNAMATMDGLTLFGGKPAHFLDGGGGANYENAKLAIETMNRDKDVKAIFINTFGGITQTDIVAEGVIAAVRENDMKVPIIVRVMGTGSDKAKELFKASRLAFILEDDFKKAAKLAVDCGGRTTVP